MSVTINNLDFTYPQAPQSSVLNIPNWSLDSGERVFLHGPSGVGKSTLLNLIGGLFAANKGTISVLGERIDKLGSRQRDKFRADHIGYVFQQFNLIPHLDVVNNVRLARYLSSNNNPNGKRAEDIEQLLTSLNVEPQHWGKQARALSIGQQQRVAIARAFVNQPELLIVDEPTSSLDTKNRDDFMQLLLNRVADSGATLIFVSHDISLSSHFTRVDSMLDINLIAGAN